MYDVRRAYVRALSLLFGRRRSGLRASAPVLLLRQDTAMSSSRARRPSRLWARCWVRRPGRRRCPRRPRLAFRKRCSAGARVSSRCQKDPCRAHDPCVRVSRDRPQARGRRGEGEDAVRYLPVRRGRRAPQRRARGRHARPSTPREREGRRGRVRSAEQVSIPSQSRGILSKRALAAVLLANDSDLPRLKQNHRGVYHSRARFSCTNARHSRERKRSEKKE